MLGEGFNSFRVAGIGIPVRNYVDETSDPFEDVARRCLNPTNHTGRHHMHVPIAE